MAIYDNIIIGAGAAGLFCAGELAGKTLVVERNFRPGVKLGISGGGNCNFSNIRLSAADYYSDNKHFASSALAGFKPGGFLDLLDGCGVKWEERDGGKLFAFGAAGVVNMLFARAEKAGAEFLFNTKVLDVKKEDVFILKTSGKELKCKNLITACGGLSYPRLGAGRTGYDIAEKAGHTLAAPRPALCPVSFSKAMRKVYAPLSGISCPAEITAGKKTVKDDLLFTHEGLSGPAVLTASLYYTGGEISVNFLPGINFAELLNQNRKGGKKFGPVLSELLPARLVKTLVKNDGIIADAPSGKIKEITAAFAAFKFTPEPLSFAKAEVTAGGVNTKEVNPSTMESRKTPRLFFIGEVLDVTGRLGGFNLHWAWASAKACAEHINKNN